MKIGVYSITSASERGSVFERRSAAFLNDVENLVSYEIIFLDDDFTDYGSYDLNVIFVRTGGTEDIFKRVAKNLRGPFFLLTTGSFNSLPASLEILSYLRQRGEEAEIIHGDTKYIASRLSVLARVRYSLKMLNGTRYGVIGDPSPWLIASNTDYAEVKRKLGIDLIDIPFEELLAEIGKKEYPDSVSDYLKDNSDQLKLEGALHIYGALSRLTHKYDLKGFTVRCFDLVNKVGNTGCIAVSILNKEGVVAGCEGDIPSMLSMAIVHQLTGKAGFMANPARINIRNNEVTFAHCTVPLSMVDEYSYDSQFESGMGVAVRGLIPVGDATIFKASAGLERYFVSDGKILKNLNEKDMCRTQIVVKPRKSVEYFFKESIGNHHIVVTGSYEALIDEFFKAMNSSWGVSGHNEDATL